MFLRAVEDYPLGSKRPVFMDGVDVWLEVRA
jgi:hypothetical protein